MWYGKFPRAHARCGRFRVRVTVRVKGEGLGLGLALWYGKKFARAHARCGRRRKMVDSQPPAAWRKRLRIIRSKDGAPIVRRAQTNTLWEDMCTKTKKEKKR